MSQDQNGTDDHAPTWSAPHLGVHPAEGTAGGGALLNDGIVTSSDPS